MKTQDTNTVRATKILSKRFQLTVQAIQVHNLDDDLINRVELLSASAKLDDHDGTPYT